MVLKTNTSYLTASSIYGKLPLDSLRRLYCVNSVVGKEREDLIIWDWTRPPNAVAAHPSRRYLVTMDHFALSLPRCFLFLSWILDPSCWNIKWEGLGRQTGIVVVTTQDNLPGLNIETRPCITFIDAFTT